MPPFAACGNTGGGTRKKRLYLPPRVMPGLDPGIHSVTSPFIEASMEWTLGSSPGVTELEVERRGLVSLSSCERLSGLRRLESGARRGVIAWCCVIPWRGFIPWGGFKSQAAKYSR